VSGAPESAALSLPKMEAGLVTGAAELRLTLPSSETAVASIIEIVRRTMEMLNLDRDWISRSELALQEALLNAHLHGNYGDSSKQIRIGCVLSATSVELRVEDDGPGYRFERPLCNIDTTAPSGRGLFLIRHMMDAVTFNITGSGIRMCLFKERDDGNQRDRD
jgi:serine/threonine-protein kinase RsbW